MTFTGKQFLLIAASVVWLAASVVPLAYLSAAHLRAVKLMSNVPTLAVAALTNPAPENGVDGKTQGGSRWKLVHLLVEGCSCSAAVAEHLCERLPLKDVEEVVYVVGGDHHFEWVNNLQRLGFDVRVQNAEELRLALGSDAGPQLLIADPTGAIRYRGGYQSTRPGTRLNHLATNMEADTPQECEILLALRQGRDVQAYPAFGCGGSLSLP